MGLGPHDSWCEGHESRRPQVHGEVSAATAMLGLDGFVLLAVSQQSGELEQAVETTASVEFCAAARSTPDLRAGPASCRPAGDPGVGEAGLAVRRAAVSGGDLVGELDRDPAPGVVDGASSGRGVPPGRAGRSLGGPGGCRVRRLVGHRDGGGRRVGDTAGRGPGPPHGGSGVGGGRDGVPDRERAASHPVRDRDGRATI
jgi:hypothetical protein